MNKLVRRTVWWFVGFALIGWISAGTTVAGSGEEGQGRVGFQTASYSSLQALVTMVCAEAMEQFDGFFATSQVLVEPFRVLGEFPTQGRISLLGVTLADQMAAVINNEPPASQVAADGEVYDQRLQGLLQEIDGYLRIHISGRNSQGEWRSFVVSVEMSEPVYRALHSYVAM